MSSLDDDIRTKAIVKKIEDMKVEIEDKLKNIVENTVQRRLQEEKSKGR